MEFTTSEALLREAAEHWRRLGNQPMLADSLSTLCRLYVICGEYDQALVCSDEAYRIGTAMHNLWAQSYSRLRIGRVYWNQGRPDRAIASMEECIETGNLAGFRVPQSQTLSDLGALYAGLGDIARGVALAETSLRHAETLFPFFCSAPSRATRTALNRSACGCAAWLRRSPPMSQPPICALTFGRLICARSPCVTEIEPRHTKNEVRFVRASFARTHKTIFK